MATVDQNVRTGDEGRKVAEEKGNQTADLVHGAKALHRRVLGNFVEIVLRNVVMDAGEHIAGADAVETDMVAAEVHGEGFRQVEHTSLCSGVADGMARALTMRLIDDVRGHGSRVDDGAALALRLHLMRGGLIDEHHAGEVDAACGSSFPAAYRRCRPGR